jgi:hypothetical protein
MYLYEQEKAYPPGEVIEGRAIRRNKRNGRSRLPGSVKLLKKPYERLGNGGIVSPKSRRKCS